MWAPRGCPEQTSCAPHQKGWAVPAAAENCRVNCSTLSGLLPFSRPAAPTAQLPGRGTVATNSRHASNTAALFGPGDRPTRFLLELFSVPDMLLLTQSS